MKRRYKILLWIAGIWIGTLLILAVPRLVSMFHEMLVLQQEFSDYGTSLVSKRYDRAYQFCGSDFRKAASYDEFVKVHHDMEEQYGSLKAVKRQALEVHYAGTPTYWNATIDADFVCEKRTLRVEFAFHKEDNRWVIFRFEPV